MNNFPQSLQNLLENRKSNHLFRTLKTDYPLIDFSSNDYLGFSSQGYLYNQIEKLDNHLSKVGATGSRLISGNSTLFNEIENEIASFHSSESALIYNSGYDANLGLLSSIAHKNDLIISDELIHASLIDGIRLSFATHYKFKHNNVTELIDLLTRHRDNYTNVFLVVESVYSMDGDCAPLVELAAICNDFNIHLIVDEAHAIGVFGEQGKGLCNLLQIENQCFARVYTYGKAMGCHGAAVVGSYQLKDYLINFSRSFIYTTAMSYHSLLAIKAAYQLLQTTNEIGKLKFNINYFNSLAYDLNFIESQSALHCCIIAGNEPVQLLENTFQTNNLFVKSIKSPTVKESQERIRICLHSFNSTDEIDNFFSVLNTQN